MQVRKASGAVVYRRPFFDKTQIMICLVKSMNGNGWVFPKGGVEPELTKRGNAVKEVYEEAGVIGLIGERVGKYRYVKGDVRQEVTMFLMQEVDTLHEYPERSERERRWFNAADAREVLSTQLQGILDQAIEMIEGE